MARRPEGALEAAKRTLAAGHPAKLRIFTPALRAFCAAGNHAKAFEASLLPAHTTLTIYPSISSMLEQVMMPAHRKCARKVLRIAHTGVLSI